MCFIKQPFMNLRVRLSERTKTIAKINVINNITLISVTIIASDATISVEFEMSLARTEIS